MSGSSAAAVAPWVDDGSGPGPIHPNDAAQARVFSQLIQAEIDDLQVLMAIAQHRWAGRREAGWGRTSTPEPVLRLREKIKELDRLRNRLEARFGAS
ncbi:hypothetical protein ACXDF8_25490 [Mycolicibacterium sp. CBM1]